MIVFPNAKINLGLHILSKRDDGYHNIETLMLPIGWSDVLEITPTMERIDQFDIDGMNDQDRLSDNLVVRALNMLRTVTPIPPIHLSLIKQIPMGAGLGGGSSDAAAVVKCLNDMFNLQVSDDKLSNLLSSLGADCPFFVKSKPQLATGIGTDLELFSMSEKLNGVYVFVVKPPFSISTKEAYAKVQPNNDRQSIREIIREYPVSQWSTLLENDFERSLVDSYPLIQEVKDHLYDKGAFYASLSGSGSAIYGLFDKPVDGLEKGFGEEYKLWQGSLVF